jgi:hypothetical protein
MFRPNRPSSGVQVAVMKDSTAHSNAVLLFLYNSVCLSTALVGPWPLFQCLILLHSRYDYFDGGSARRKAATCTQ